MIIYQLEQKRKVRKGTKWFHKWVHLGFYITYELSQKHFINKKGTYRVKQIRVKEK